jgi:iron complex outermembrane recepter protein
MKIRLLILSLLSSSFAFADDIKQLSPTVVTATRVATDSFDLPLSIDSISGENVRDARLGANLAEVAPKIPGVVINWRGGAAQELSISTRGFGARSAFGAKGVRIYQDGIPLTTPDGQGQLGAINLDTLGSVEFLRGPFSVLYGNSSGGVVQAFTRDGAKDPTLSATATHGSYATNRDSLTYEGQYGKLNYIVNTSQLNTDGYRYHSAYRKDNFNTKLSYEVSADTKLTLLANYIDQPYTDDPISLTPSAFRNNPKQTGSNAIASKARVYRYNTYSGLVLDHNISDKDSIKIMAYTGHRENLQYLNTDAASAISRDVEGVDFRWTRKDSIFNRPITFVTGFNYDSMDDLRSRYTATNGEIGPRTRLENQKAFNIDEFIQLSFEPSEKWLLLAGLRNSRVNFSAKDQITPSNSGYWIYNNLSPAIGVTYKVTPRLNIYANYGKGFETPTFSETTYKDATLGTGPNFSLLPSKSKNFEVGLKAFVTDNTRINVALFKSDTTNEIVAAKVNSSQTQYDSTANTEKIGVEFSLDSRLPYNFNFYEAYTYLDASFKNKVVNSSSTVLAYDGNRPAGTYRNSSYTELSWKYPSFGFQGAIENIYYGSTSGYDSNLVANTAEAYSLINLKASLKQEVSNWKITEFVRIDNATNKSYVSNVKVNSADTFEPGNNRNYTVGITSSYTFK